jgi:hypothetical protein
MRAWLVVTIIFSYALIAITAEETKVAPLVKVLLSKQIGQQPTPITEELKKEKMALLEDYIQNHLVAMPSDKDQELYRALVNQAIAEGNVYSSDLANTLKKVNAQSITTDEFRKALATATDRQAKSKGSWWGISNYWSSAPQLPEVSKLPEQINNKLKDFIKSYTKENDLTKYAKNGSSYVTNLLHVLQKQEPFLWSILQNYYQKEGVSSIEIMVGMELSVLEQQEEYKKQVAQQQKNITANATERQKLLTYYMRQNPPPQEVQAYWSKGTITGKYDNESVNKHFLTKATEEYLDAVNKALKTSVFFGNPAQEKELVEAHQQLKDDMSYKAKTQVQSIVKKSKEIVQNPRQAVTASQEALGKGYEWLSKKASEASTGVSGFLSSLWQQKPKIKSTAKSTRKEKILPTKSYETKKVETIPVAPSIKPRSEQESSKGELEKKSLEAEESMQQKDQEVYKKLHDAELLTKQSLEQQRQAYLATYLEMASFPDDTMKQYFLSGEFPENIDKEAVIAAIMTEMEIQLQKENPKLAQVLDTAGLLLSGKNENPSVTTESLESDIKKALEAINHKKQPQIEKTITPKVEKIEPTEKEKPQPTWRDWFGL